MAMDDLLTINAVVMAACEFVDEYPERATRKLRNAVDAMKKLNERPIPESICKRCGHPVMDPLNSGRWVHNTSSMDRGCRAASFSRDGRWDDSLDRHWVATPTVVTEAARRTADA